MSEPKSSSGQKAELKGRKIRADARQNELLILETARKVFMASGVDAPVRDIANQAGVGIATLYRRFPTRGDLIAAVFRHEIDKCAAHAVVLSKDHAPGAAVALWLRYYAAFITTKKGMASALHSGDPAFAALPDYFREQNEPALANLLAKAARAGEMRADVDAYDLLRAIGNLSSVKGDEGEAHIARMLSLLIDGLRKT